jgi:hypothetical protein
MRLALIAISLLAAAPALAREPDFYVAMQTCKTVVGYLVLSDESLKVFEGDPTVLACARTGKTVDCLLSFPKPGQTSVTGDTINYQVLADSPPHLILSNSNGSEFLSIDLVQRAAVSITRHLDVKLAGSKVCQGVYATSFDLSQ